MKVVNPVPVQKIAAYVDRILVIENHGGTSPFTMPLFANGVPTLVFKSVRAVLGKDKTSNLTLFGQTIFPGEITFTEDFVFIAYFLKPYSLQSMFGVAALALTDKPTDLHLILPRKAAELQERLLNAATIEKMINLLDNFIFNLISHAGEVNPLIKYASTRIAEDHSRSVLGLVQKELHVTERTFQRVFESQVGIAPNIYRRICQFNAAFQQLSLRNHNKLSDIAFDNGYADQSHYIRSFKEFTGITPRDYLNFGT